MTVFPSLFSIFFYNITAHIQQEKKQNMWDFDNDNVK